MKVENDSPLRPIKHVLVGAPGTEAVLGLAIDPSISLFEPDSSTTASVIAARADHEKMVSELQKRGIEVFNMRRIIGEKLASRNQSGIQSAQQLLAELTVRAEKLHSRYGLGNLELIMHELATLLQTDVLEMGEASAVAINGALTNIIDLEGRAKAFKPTQSPAANFMFWRDTNHITGKTMGTHRMFYDIRQQEVAIAQIGLQALGIKYTPVLPPNSQDSIEGGDILPFELDNQKYALIGQAQRTSAGGVDAWFKLHEQEFSATGEGIIPAVVEGPNHDTQNQMHLDTYAQQVARDAVIYCGEIADNRKISILQRKGGDIVRVDTMQFSRWIEKKAGQTFNMTRQNQLDYAPNVLVDGGRDTVYMTRDDSPEVAAFIRNQVAELVMLNIPNLTKLYGGAHCSTSEIR